MTAMHYSFNLLLNGDADSVRIYWSNYENTYVPHVQYIQDGIETTVCILNGKVYFVSQDFVG